MSEKGLQLTSRDRAIVERISQLRVVETQQIAWLFFKRFEAACNRLNRLAKAGFLRRVKPGGRATRSFWCAGPEARKRLGARVSGFGSLFAIEHQVGLNWVYCFLVGSGERRARSIQWKDGYGLKYPAADSWIRPDAVIESVRNKTTVMLEYDNDSKSLPRIRENLSNYLSWWRMNPSDHPCVLFYVVCSETRGKAIQEEWLDLSGGTSRLELDWAITLGARETISKHLGLIEVGGFKGMGWDDFVEGVKLTRAAYEVFSGMQERHGIPETEPFRAVREALPFWERLI